MIMIRLQMHWFRKKKNQFVSSLIPSKEKDFPVRKTKLAGTTRHPISGARWNQFRADMAELERN